MVKAGHDGHTENGQLENKTRMVMRRYHALDKTERFWFIFDTDTTLHWC